MYMLTYTSDAAYKGKKWPRVDLMVSSLLIIGLYHISNSWTSNGTLITCLDNNSLADPSADIWRSKVL